MLEEKLEIHSSVKCASVVVSELLSGVYSLPLWRVSQWEQYCVSEIPPGHFNGRVDVHIFVQKQSDKHLIFKVYMNLVPTEDTLDWHPQSINGFRSGAENSIEYCGVLNTSGVWETIIQYDGFPFIK